MSLFEVGQLLLQLHALLSSLPGILDSLLQELSLVSEKCLVQCFLVLVYL
jgi:hypothetical protein